MGFSCGPCEGRLLLKKRKAPVIREITAPNVRIPCAGNLTSRISNTNAKAINASPAQFGARNQDPKRKSMKAILPITPGMIAPGCDTSTNIPMRATINNRKITLGSSSSDKKVSDRLFILSSQHESIYSKHTR